MLRSLLTLLALAQLPQLSSPMYFARQMLLGPSRQYPLHSRCFLIHEYPFLERPDLLPVLILPSLVLLPGSCDQTCSFVPVLLFVPIAELALVRPVCLPEL